MFHVVVLTRRFGNAKTSEVVMTNSDVPTFAEADVLAGVRAAEHAKDVMVSIPEQVGLGKHRVRPTAYSSVTYVVMEIV